MDQLKSYYGLWLRTQWEELIVFLATLHYLYMKMLTLSAMPPSLPWYGWSSCGRYMFISMCPNSAGCRLPFHSSKDENNPDSVDFVVTVYRFSHQHDILLVEQKGNAQPDNREEMYSWLTIIKDWFSCSRLVSGADIVSFNSCKYSIISNVGKQKFTNTVTN